MESQADKIQKQTVEEMVSVEQNLQVQLKNVLVSMEAKRTDFDHIRHHVNKVKKYASDLQTETSFTKDSNSDGKSSFSS
jgi:hypothetical protein